MAIPVGTHTLEDKVVGVESLQVNARRQGVMHTLLKPFADYYPPDGNISNNMRLKKQRSFKKPATRLPLIISETTRCNSAFTIRIGPHLPWYNWILLVSQKDPV